MKAPAVLREFLSDPDARVRAWKGCHGGFALIFANQWMGLAELSRMVTFEIVFSDSRCGQILALAGKLLLRKEMFMARLVAMNAPDLSQESIWKSSYEIIRWFQNIFWNQIAHVLLKSWTTLFDQVIISPSLTAGIIWSISIKLRKFITFGRLGRWFLANFQADRMSRSCLSIHDIMISDAGNVNNDIMYDFDYELTCHAMPRLPTWFQHSFCTIILWHWQIRQKGPADMSGLRYYAPHGRDRWWIIKVWAPSDVIHPPGFVPDAAEKRSGNNFVNKWWDLEKIFLRWMEMKL